MTTYEAYYMLGKLDKEEGRECNHGNAHPHLDAFNGYIDGYCGHVIREPVFNQLLIEQLEKEGMTFISDNLLKKG